MTTASAFRHPAFFYRDDAEYTARTSAFVRAGLAAGEGVAVAAPPDRLRLLHGALGPDAAAVRFTDMTGAGRNPGRIIPLVLRAFCDAQPPGRRVRIVGEPVWPGRTSLEYPACVQHEALINTAFEGRPVTILCPYDAARLTPSVLADARATHPAVIEGGRESLSPGYAPQRAAAAYNTPPAAPRDAACQQFDRQGLRGAREFAVRVAGGLGMAGSRLDDLALTVAELTTNSVLHGGGSGVVRVWAADGGLACEVRDGGRIGDPLAGRTVPPPAAPAAGDC